MLGFSNYSKRFSHDEAEKPFWISFGDLMTALMVLFLVSLAAALFAIVAPAGTEARSMGERATEIQTCLLEIQVLAHSYPGAEVRGETIDFGTWAYFPNNSSTLTAGQKTALRWFVPEILNIATGNTCKHWLRRVIVEGFSSATGGYLHNLDLSTRRSEQVLCALFESAGTHKLTDSDRELIKRLFFVGGYSFNNVKDTPQDSRRIELQLEFYRLHESQETPPPMVPDRNEPCPIENR